MKRPADSTVPANWNLPNRITMARIVLTVIMFVALHLSSYGLALVLFIFAAGTDWLDGYLARRLGQVTQLGRILDPLADKLVICGAFVFLSSVPASGIPAWFTVIVVGRELVVTVVRSFLEQQGHDFSANLPGKLKMVFQCSVVIFSLLLLWRGQLGFERLGWLTTVVMGLMWLAVASTVYSGAIYLIAAARLSREP